MNKETVVVLLVFLSFAIVLGFILVIVYVVSMHQKSRNKFLLEMEEMKSNFRNELLQSQLEMQEQTFESISMEIHDNVSQVLSVSKLNLGMIDQASPDVLEKVRYSIELMNHAMNDLRDLSRRLDSDLIKREGLITAVEEYVAQLRRSIKKEVIFVCNGDVAPIGVDKELILFRILQEAVNNILKHGQASRIEIVIQYTLSQLQLEITDNGNGFAPNEVVGKLREGSGLKNMQKRTSMIHGEFLLDATPGAGTRIRVTTPIQEFA